MKTNAPTFLLLFLFALLFLAPFATFAQSAQSIQLKPAVIEDKVNPGQTYRFSVTVTNRTDREQTFYLLAQDIERVDDDGTPVFAPEGVQTPFQLSAWISLDKESVTLQGGESETVPFAVHVPRDAAPGAHFGGIFFDSRPPKMSETGAAVGARVGSIINLRIAGEAIEDIVLREFSTDRFVYSKPPVNFITKIDNKGNVLIRPQGLIEISDMFGKKVANVQVNTSGSGVFPGSNRDYNAVWDDGFVFGRYEALLSVVYGDEGRKTIVRSTSFWVLPLNVIGWVLGSLMAGLLFLFVVVRLYIRKKLHDMGASGKSDFHAEKYQRPLTRLTFIVAGLLLFCVLLFILLFIMFA